MSWLEAFRYRLRGLLRRDLTERELDSEFAFHLEMEMRANLDRGLSPDDARARAKADFGDGAAVRDALRDARDAQRFAGFVQDARHAVRRVWRERVFSAVVVVTLALGLGWSTAIFSVVDRALVRPLSYDEPDQLVHLWERRERSTMDHGELSAPELRDLRAVGGPFADIAAYRQGGFALSIDGNPDRIGGVSVSASFFPVLRVRPALGRAFDERDDQPGAPRTAMLSDAAWRARFGASPSVIGRRVSLDGEPATIIGVLPRDFRFVLATTAELWVPIQIDPLAMDRSNRWIRAIARLRPGVTVAGARTTFDAAIRRMAVEYPETTTGRAGNLVSLRDEMIGNNGTVLLALLIGVAALLLTGCANVAGLLMSRVAGRSSELAVRRAMGAEPARIVGQVLVENLVLSLLGGALGVGVAWLALRLLLAQVPPALVAAFPFVADTSIDGRMVALAAALSLVTGVFCGAAPAIAAARHAPAQLLRAGARSLSSNASWRRSLVAGQIALTFLLVACSSLLGRSLVELLRGDLGFRPERLLTFGITLNGARYATPEARAAAFDRIERDLREAPELESVAVGSVLPLEFGSSGSFALAGDRSTAEQPYARFRPVLPAYLAALGIPIAEGRGFSAADTVATGGVIVSASLVRAYASRGARIGGTVDFGSGPRLIVGVVGDVRLSLDQDPTPMVYFAISSGSVSSLRFAVRTRGEAAAATARVRTIVHAVDPELPVLGARTMQDALESSRPVFLRRFPMLITSVFSLVGIVLAGIGVFGVVAHAVAQRTREFGIRMALGASRRSVVRLSARDAVVATVSGILMGVVVSFVAARGLSALLFGVRPADVASYVVTTGVVLATALAASLLPARRAVGISPSTAIRDG
jgi:predicted permease